MIRATRSWGCIAVISIVLLSAVSYAQSDVPDKAKVVQHIRELYYTPSEAGLRSFSCEANVDWRSILQQAAGGKAVAVDDARLLYLDQAKYKLHASLPDESVVIDFAAPSGIQPANSARLDGMIAGARQMLGGLLRQSVDFLNGKFIPRPNEDFVLQRSDDGYRLILTRANKTGHQSFSPDYTLWESRVTENGQNVDLLPMFAKTDQGLLFTGFEGTFGSSGSAPVAITIHVRYQSLDGYQIPSGLKAEVNGNEFNFDFSKCQINQDVPVVNQSSPAKSN